MFFAEAFPRTRVNGRTALRVSGPGTDGRRGSGWHSR